MNQFRTGMTLQEKLRGMETRPREEQVLINEAYLAAQEAGEDLSGYHY